MKAEAIKLHLVRILGEAMPALSAAQKKAARALIVALLQGGDK